MRGFGFLAWVLIAVVLIVGPYILMGIRPEFKYLIMLLILMGMYNFFRNFFGDSWITFGLTGVTFYYLVWKHFWTFSMIWWIYVLAGLGVFMTLGWTYITLASFTKRLGKR